MLRRTISCPVAHSERESTPLPRAQSLPAAFPEISDAFICADHIYTYDMPTLKNEEIGIIPVVADALQHERELNLLPRANTWPGAFYMRESTPLPRAQSLPAAFPEISDAFICADHIYTYDMPTLKNEEIGIIPVAADALQHERELNLLPRANTWPGAFYMRESTPLPRAQSLPAAFPEISDAFICADHIYTYDMPTLKNEEIGIIPVAADALQHERELNLLPRTNTWPGAFYMRESTPLPRAQSLPSAFPEISDAFICADHIYTYDMLILKNEEIGIIPVAADALQHERELNLLPRANTWPGAFYMRESTPLPRAQSLPAAFPEISDAFICVDHIYTYDMPTLKNEEIGIIPVAADALQHERELNLLPRANTWPGAFYMRESTPLPRAQSLPAAFPEISADHIYTYDMPTLKNEEIGIIPVAADALQHERDDSDDTSIFDIGCMCIFDMPRPENEEEVVSEIVSISPVDMPRPANEPEIVSEARESVSIPPVASNAASSNALAIQLPSDVKSQPRLSSLIASGLLAVLGGLTIGYALNATGGAIGIEGFMLQFSRRIHNKSEKAATDNFCAYINFWLILFSSIVQLSAIPSVWAAGGMIESWGRKPVLIVGSILQLVGSILMYWFPNDVVASIGLTIIGCSVALLNLVIPIILSEINIGKAPKWISHVFNSMVLWGSTSTKVVNLAASHNFRYGWRWSFASSGFLALPLLVLSFFLSETPRFLIKKGSMEEAKASIKTFRKSGAEAELQMLADLIDNEGKGTRKKLSRSPLLLLNTAAQIFQQVSGLDSILFFGPFILQSAGYSYNASFVAPLIAGVIRAGVAGLTFPSYSYFGRRRTLVSACLGMVVAQISLLGLFLLVGDPIFQLSQKNAYVGMAFAIPLIGFYSMFSGPSEWTEESYSEDIRVLGSCWEMSISLLMSLIMNPAVLLLLCALKAWIFLLFAALTLGVCFSIYKLLPERKKKEDEGVEEDLFKRHWFWKRFIPKEGSVEAV